jgi:hypothetical protein
MPIVPEPITAILLHELAGKVVDQLADGALERCLRRRLDVARKVLQKRMAKGELWVWTEDDAAAALFTYMRAAQEGAARLNLEFMADAITNGIHEPTFAPDAFRRHCAALSMLSRDEALVLVGLIKVHDTPQEEGKNGNAGWRLKSDPAAFGLPPSLDVMGCAQSLTRTGWVVLASLWGGMGFDFSSSFEEVRRLVDFEMALSRAATSVDEEGNG